MTKVMIVDDEKYVRMGIKNETDWALIGCEVVAEASNGIDALEAAEQTRPDLVISDIRMPKMDGLELAEQLMSRFPGIKIIFLTAYDEFEYARQAVRLGASDYLLKPFGEGELEASVQKLLHLHPNTPASSKELEEKLVPLNIGAATDNRYVKAAIDYISEHYNDPDFSIGVLADKIGVSEGYISRLFKSEADTGINNYLIRCRIRKAMDLLKDPLVKVYEVAEKVGYQDIAYFSNTFKKLVGKSPSEYQQKGLE